MIILTGLLFNELEDFLPQGAVRRRPKKVPLSFSALARGALQAPGCAEDRHSLPAGPPEGREAMVRGAREEMMTEDTKNLLAWKIYPLGTPRPLAPRAQRDAQRRLRI
jgi:hypothetical protein